MMKTRTLLFFFFLYVSIELARGERVRVYVQVTDKEYAKEVH